VHASRLTAAAFSVPTDDFDGLFASKPSIPPGTSGREREPQVEIAVFVVGLAFLAVASYFAGVNSRELELVRRPDIQRWSR
jgi:hypothetical protein